MKYDHNTYNNPLKKNKLVIRNYVLIGVGFGFFFPLIAWLIDIPLQDLTYNFSGIYQIHSNNPIHFIIDCAPFILGAMSYIFVRISLEVTTQLKLEIKEKEEIIEKNARIAQRIGEKDFNLSLDDINEKDELGKALLIMRKNLSEADEKENELNWIARGKDQISDILRSYNNIEKLASEALISLINYIDAIQGAFYLYNDDTHKLVNIAAYAYNRKKFISQEYSVGEGLIGQAAYEKEIVCRTEIPDSYITITSGILGDKKPKSLLIVPLISDEKLQGIIEFTSFEPSIKDLTIKLVRELGNIIGQTIFNLKVNTRTEKLLKEAQEMTEELQENQHELRKNAVEMKKTQEELKKTNIDLESKIIEVRNAQKRLHSLLENASEVISIIDEHGYVKYESPSVKHILGYSPEEVIGQNAFQTGVSSSPRLQKAFYELLENDSFPITFEFQFEKGYGDVIWLESTGRNLIRNSAIEGVIFNIRDITVRKIAEKAQRMSGQMQALSENSPDMIIRLSTDEVFFYANPVVKTFTGVNVKQIIQKTIDEVSLPEEVVTFFKSVIKSISTNKEKENHQINFPTKFGLRIMQVNAIPEFNEDKEMETILFVAHDITEQKRIEKVIKDKNKAINDSINYAQRIQTAILPNNKVITQYLPKSFIFYNPRDVVSGDFPWFFVKNDNIYIAAVDCTGHGVPGALLSFIGYFLLNNIVDHDTEMTASHILDSLHENVRTTLRQDQIDASARDGMDIAFCKINLKRREVQYAGAHRPLYLFREGELIQYKGNPKAIGGIPDRKKKEKSFVNHIISIEEKDRIFFFSDGLPDQVGGEQGKKYQPVRIRDVIVNNPDYTMQEFATLFEKDFSEWKSGYKQIDDVLLIGIEF